MKHIKLYEDFSDEKVDEGFKDWVIGGLLALSSINPSLGKDSAISPTNQIEYQVQSTDSEDIIVSGLLKYYNKIATSKLSFSKDGKFITVKGNNFTGGFSQGTGYNKYNCFFVFGNQNKPDAQLSITMKDDGSVSIYFAEERLKATREVDLGVAKRKMRKGTQLFNQTEIKKGEKGYNEAIKILNLFANR